MYHTVAMAALLWFVVEAVAIALSPASDLLVPAAARTDQWTTDLYLFNPGNEETVVEVHWLVRGQPNPDPVTLMFSLAPDETRVLADIISNGFGLHRGAGAFRIVSSHDIVGTCRIYATEGGASFGQAFEAVPETSATTAGTATHVIGLSSNDAFRSNLYALASDHGAEVQVALHDAEGVQLASTVLSLGAYQPYLAPITRLLAIESFDDGTLFVRVTSGSAVVGASKVDNLSSDPTTLASWIPGAGDPVAAGSYFGVVVGARGATGGGMTVRVNGHGEVTGLELGYPSDRCPVLFSAGEDLSDDPLPLEDLANGHSFTSSYPGGGDMTWSLQLEPKSDGPTLGGSLSATGSGWTGDLEECNGDHGASPVTLGTWQR